MHITLIELRGLFDKLTSAGFSTDDVLRTLHNTGYDIPGFDDVYDWYWCNPSGSTECPYEGSGEPDVISPRKGWVEANCKAKEILKEASMSKTCVSDVMFEQAVMRIDEKMAKANSPAEALDALAAEGLSYTVSQAPEAQVSTIKGDYNKPLEGGSVMRATVMDGVVQYTVMKDTLIGRDYWVQLSAR